MTNQTKDPHSHFEPGHPRIKHMAWTVGFDFDAKRVLGTVHHAFDKGGHVILDTRDLEIIRVYAVDGTDIVYDLGERHPVLGSPLSFIVPDDAEVMIEYLTSPDASGIQWMSAELAGGHPFVYTQGEAINARSYIPCQDTPGVKFTLDASLEIPSELRGLVAAPDHLRVSVGRPGYSVEVWRMPYPITSYLIAFAVGELVSEDISDRSRVWSQPSMIDKAAHDFRDFPTIMLAGEELFGPYPFGRCDILVMPAAFPYGGMENPTLMFVSPSTVAGDGSGISVIVHELAHSWMGNLVTNADWASFWLNEGWTVWGEGRIMEEVYGSDVAMVSRKLLQREFDDDCEGYCRRCTPFLTKLMHGQDDVDPDDIFSRVPYHKGAQFLRRLEDTVGRRHFDVFMLEYIKAYRYQSLTAGQFIAFATKKLGAAVMKEVDAHAWVYGEGMPANDPEITSPSIVAIEEAVRSLALPDPSWSVPEQQLYLELLMRPLSHDLIAEIDAVGGFSTTLNVEVRWSFFMLALKSGYGQVLPQVEAFLLSQGRMKYLKPLYGALGSLVQGREHATRILGLARHAYHPVAISTIERELSHAA